MGKKHNKVESVLYKRAGKTSNEANIEILKKKTLHNSAKKKPPNGLNFVCVCGRGIVEDAFCDSKSGSQQRKNGKKICFIKTDFQVCGKPKP